MAAIFGENVDMNDLVDVEYITNEPAARENLEEILSDPTENVENVLPVQFIAVDGSLTVDYEHEGLTNRDPLSTGFRVNSIWVRRNFLKTISGAAAEEKESRKRQLVIYDPDDGVLPAKNQKSSSEIDTYLTRMRK